MAKRRRSRYVQKAAVMSRRGFLKAAGALGAAYWLGPKLMLGGKAYAEPIPGGTLESHREPTFRECVNHPG